MANKLVIDGKDYDLPASFTLGEARLIKQYSGLGVAEIPIGLAKFDPDLIAALCIIVTQRAGRQISQERLANLDVNEIDFEIEDDEDPEPTDPPNASGGSGGSAIDENTISPGSSGTTPVPAGSPSTATSSTSAPATSQTSPSSS